jgi:hypothetical protein
MDSIMLPRSQPIDIPSRKVSYVPPIETISSEIYLEYQRLQDKVNKEPVNSLTRFLFAAAKK